MTAENLLNAFSYIDDGLVENTGRVLKKRRFKGFMKIAASAAAALMLVFGGYQALYNTVLVQSSDKNKLPPAVIADVDGKSYEKIHKKYEKDFRKSTGLPKLSDDIKGDHLGKVYVERYDEEISAYVDFYTLCGYDYRNVLVGEVNGELFYWSILNFRGIDYRTFETVEEQLGFYGYFSAADIHEMLVGKKTVNDREKIEEVWDEFINGALMTDDEYDSAIKGENYDEANAGKVYTAHADSAVYITLNYGEPNSLGLTYYTDMDVLRLGFFVLKSENKIF